MYFFKNRYSPKKVGKNLKRKFQFQKEKTGSKTDTKIEPWFRFPIPIPNFVLTPLNFTDWWHTSHGHRRWIFVYKRGEFSWTLLVNSPRVLENSPSEKKCPLEFAHFDKKCPREFTVHQNSLSRTYSKL